MQGLILQLSRGGFLVLLWLFIWLVLRALRTDLLGGTPNKGNGSPAGGNRRIFGRDKTIRFLAVTQGALAGTRISLTDQPVLIGRANDSTLVLDDDYASNRHARLTPHGNDWFVEDLGSTNGTYLDRTKVSTPVKVSLGSQVRIGKTVIELRS